MAASTGIMSTFAGIMEGFGGDGGGATGALLDTPTAVVLDAAGNLYIADTYNNRIRKVRTDGNINTFVGDGNDADFGDGGPAISASLNRPDGTRPRQRWQYLRRGYGEPPGPESHPRRHDYHVAGNGSGGFQGDGGPATEASLYYPKGIVVDPSTGNLYIADWLNSRVRVVTPDGNINTVAGNGSYDYYGDGGPATSAALRFPWGLTVDPAGNVYVADDENSTIRKLTPVAPLVSAIPKAAAPNQCLRRRRDVTRHSADFPPLHRDPGLRFTARTWPAHSRDWTVADFHGAQAPTSLDGTAVTIGGHAAFISYISPTQINAQVPSGVALGAQDVRVTTAAGTSDPQTVAVNQVEPGLLAPATLNVGGKQYTEALFPDGATFVLPAGAMPSGVARACPPRGHDRSLRRRVWYGDSGPGRG